jgi:hypothetical protein
MVRIVALPSRFNELIRKWAKSPGESIKQANGPIGFSYRFVMIEPRPAPYRPIAESYAAGSSSQGWKGKFHVRLQYIIGRSGFQIVAHNVSF